MIEAFFLAAGRQELLAVYHGAADPASDVLTLVCPPLFSEGMRTQLALRELAIALAEAGQHVLRFDWRGTGDSTGSLADVRVADWFADVAAVIGEGRDITGAGRINAVGVRAGALFLCGALRGGVTAEKIVLWDPVTSGADYLGQLRRVQERMLARNRYLKPALRKLAASELGGQRLPQELRADIEALDGGVYANLPAEGAAIIATDERAAFGAASIEPRVIRFNCNWETDSEDIMLPQPVLEGIRECLVEP